MKDDYTPLLGRYDTLDDIVRWKHIDWAGYTGINVFFIDGEYVFSVNTDRYDVPTKFLGKRYEGRYLFWSYVRRRTELLWVRIPPPAPYPEEML